MHKVKTKHFQYTGLDDYDKMIDEQINEFMDSMYIGTEQLISILYAAHPVLGVNNYSALLVYKTEKD